ncbi:MAG: hypothetical protein IT384_00120 [Deltaproteobacteria bacterium]|nr:hypothetical protein [Deltaproteobacteria bacterium]
MTVLLCAVACGSDPELPPDPSPADASVDAGPTDGGPIDAGSIAISLTHTATSPLGAAVGPVTFVTDEIALAATETGVRALRTSGPSAGQSPAGFQEWALTSTGSGAAASAIAVPPAGALGGTIAVFLPAGQPQLGALEVGGPGAQGVLLGEAMLDAPLAGSFPAGLLAPASGPGSDALWIADAPFGPGGVLRAYPYASWTPAARRLHEDAGRSYTPVATDLDGDGSDEVPVLGRPFVSADGALGLSTFTVAGNSAPGAAGGVDVFDLATGDLLGRVVVPVADSSTGTLGFVGSAAIWGDWLVVAAADKDATFADVGGQLAIYRIQSRRPFRVVDVDPAADYDQPTTRIPTSTGNTVAVTVVDRFAFVLSAPFFGDATIDVIDLGAPSPEVIEVLEIGPPFATGMNIPQEPSVSPDGTQLLLGTEHGIVRIELERR